MNIRKCPKCGGIVPEGNSTCNNCGHKMFLFGGGGLYVGSSKNANKLDTKENPFSDGKNNKGCVGWIIFIIIGVIVIQSISVVMEAFNEAGVTFDDLFKDFDTTYDDEDDFYVESNLTCDNFCVDENYSVKNGYCFCSDGASCDITGNSFYTSTGNEKDDMNNRCTLFCNGAAAYLGGACYCKNGNRYSVTADVIGKSDEVVIQNLINDLNNKKNVLIYGPGDGEGNYTFADPIDPVQLEEFMRDYDYEVYYLDYDGMLSDAREELRNDYRIMDFSVPYYYLFRNGETIKNGVFFNSLNELKSVLDNNEDIIISQ